MVSKPIMKPLAPIAERFSSFQSNEDRKREQRAGYHRDFDGPAARWMGSGVCPPKKGGQGRMAR